MNKKVKLILTSLLLFSSVIFYSCSKEESIKSQANNTSTNTVKPKKYLKEASPELSIDEVVRTIQTFQQIRKEYWKTGNAPDYSQEQGLFQMSLVLNFELPGYGYFTDLENEEMEIQIENNGKTETGETLLNGKDMFLKYREIENHIKRNQSDDRKLYFTDFSIKEVTDNYTLIKLQITSGKFNTVYAGNDYEELPIIPINSYATCEVTGTPGYVAQKISNAFNTPILNVCYAKHPNFIWVDVYPDMYLRYVSPDPYYESTWWVYHASYPSSINAASYMSAYNNWVKGRRLFALANNRYARKVNVDYVYYPEAAYGWENFRSRHSIDIIFVKKEYIPSLFNAAGIPIIN